MTGHLKYLQIDYVSSPTQAEGIPWVVVGIDPGKPNGTILIREIEGCAAHIETQDRGYCQSSIVEASDGLLYVLKIAGDHVPNMVFNEAFGAELFRSFGLPTAEWLPLQLDDEFIQSNPDMWFKTGHHRLRPVSGLHFGRVTFWADPIRI